MDPQPMGRPLSPESTSLIQLAGCPVARPGTNRLHDGQAFVITKGKHRGLQ